MAYLERLKGTLEPDTLIILNLSGRGDKDLDEFIIRREQRDGGGGQGAPSGNLFC